MQFASIFDLNCSTILSNSLSNDNVFPSFPSFDPNPLPFPKDWAVETTPQKLKAPGEGTLGVLKLKWSLNLELEKIGDLLKQLLKVKSFDWAILALCSSIFIVILGNRLKSSDN